MKFFTIQAVVLGVGIGVAAGVGAYTFIYAKGSSYLTNDPAACANCHVMQEYYDAWVKSSHRAVAVCNDCHTPHSLVPKYMTKASNGYHHSMAFTTGDFPDNIRIKPHNREITEHACRSCHETVVQEIEHPDSRGEVSCIRCHDTVGHMR
jgi:cytochrome c nitrite reductase small subunit